LPGRVTRWAGSKIVRSGERRGYYMMSWSERISSSISRIFDDEDGQGLTEYALILALIAVVAILALTLLGGSVTSALSTAANSL
jgi:pilus assembly protein Flp/PilA